MDEVLAQNPSNLPPVLMTSPPEAELSGVMRWVTRSRESRRWRRSRMRRKSSLSLGPSKKRRRGRKEDELLNVLEDMRLLFVHCLESFNH